MNMGRVVDAAQGRLAGRAAGPRGVGVRFYFSDADPVAECECGWRAVGDSATDAFRAWWRHIRDNHPGAME